MTDIITLRWDDTMHCYRVDRPNFATDGPVRLVPEGDLHEAQGEITGLREQNRLHNVWHGELQEKVRIAEAERDERESPEVKAVNDAFDKVVVNQRNHAWVESERHKDERDQALADLLELGRVAKLAATAFKALMDDLLPIAEEVETLRAHPAYGTRSIIRRWDEFVEKHSDFKEGE